MSQQHVIVEGYTIIGLIGRGGSSSVYRGHQDAFDRDVAVKVLEVDPRDDDARRRFVRECAAAGRVSTHPNIVTILDSGVTGDGRPYLTTELCPTGSLADRARSQGPMSVSEVLRIGVKLSGALATAHAAGILHRDVKPDNVLTTAFGEPALTDFGISTVGEQAPSTTTRGSYTLHHAPPETLSGGQITASADIYGLCSTLHHLLAGHPPFGAESSVPLATIVHRVMHDSPPPIARSDIPAVLLTVLATGMAKDASARQPSAEALGDALRSAQLSIGEAATEMVVLGAGAAAPMAPSSSPSPSAPNLAPPRTPPAENTAIVDGTVVRRPIAAGALPDPGASAQPPPSSTSIDGPTPALPPPPPPALAGHAVSVTAESTMVGGVHALSTPIADTLTQAERSPSKRRVMALVVVAVLLAIGVGAYFALRGGGDPSASTIGAATTTTTQATTPAALSPTTLFGAASPTSSPASSPTGASSPGATVLAATATTSSASTTIAASATPTTAITLTTRSTGATRATSATTTTRSTVTTTASTAPPAPTTGATTAATTTVAPTTTAPHLSVTSVSASPSTAPCGASPTTEVTLTWKTTLAASVTIGIENPQPFEQGLPANGSFTVPFTGCSNGNGKVTYYVVAKGFNGVDATTATIVVNASV